MVSDKCAFIKLFWVKDIIFLKCECNFLNINSLSFSLLYEVSVLLYGSFPHLEVINWRRDGRGGWEREGKGLSTTLSGREKVEWGRKGKMTRWEEKGGRHHRITLPTITVYNALYTHYNALLRYGPWSTVCSNALYTNSQPAAHTIHSHFNVLQRVGFVVTFVRWSNQYHSKCRQWLISILWCYWFSSPHVLFFFSDMNASFAEFCDLIATSYFLSSLHRS